MKTIPALKELNNLKWSVTHNIGIQVNWKELTDDLRLKKTFGFKKKCSSVVKVISTLVYYFSNAGFVQLI